MNKRHTIAVAAPLLLLVVAFFTYQMWSRDGNAPRASMLSAMPSGTSTVIFADFSALRQSPFTTQLLTWAPRPQVDDDYTQFLRETGFDYERDLDRVAIAAIKRERDTAFFVVADGRFDQKKIDVYASQFGTPNKLAGREIFSVLASTAAPNPTPRKISLTFLGSDRIALSSGADLADLLSTPATGQDAKDWRERFDRLAGSPVFAVIRQDAAPGTALSSRAPGGFQSPQLSSLLDQLQWITIAGKPDGDRLRVVGEGESASDMTAHQLADMLNGILVMAQAGLSGPQVRQQLNPQARETYLDALKGAEVSRIDRGDTKSVRVVFNVSPQLLAIARSHVPVLAPASSADPAPRDPAKDKPVRKRRK